MLKIHTAFGVKTIVRRVGTQGWYYQEAPNPSAPHGAWWLAHPSKGFVPVPSNSRALMAAIELNGK